MNLEGASSARNRATERTPPSGARSAHRRRRSAPAGADRGAKDPAPRRGDEPPRAATMRSPGAIAVIGPARRTHSGEGAD